MNCMYCEKGEKLAGAAIKICDLKTTELYLFREQTYRGRLVLVLKRHAEELYQLDREEGEGFMEDLRRATEAMAEVLRPDKINCGMFGDEVKHLHVHIVPKYQGGPEWNKIFQMNPRQVYLEQADCAQMINAYREKLAKKE